MNYKEKYNNALDMAKECLKDGGISQNTIDYLCSIFPELAESEDEMARINKKETGKCIFPFNKWEVKIWSNDHNPPHFHIMCNGWNVSYCIEDGSLLEVLSKGKESGDYDYMQANVEKWLSAKCFAQPKLTNRENAILQWEQLHED